MDPNEEFVSLKEFISKHSHLISITQVRSWRTKDINNAREWTTKIGKHVYVNVPKFKEWLNSIK